MRASIPPRHGCRANPPGSRIAMHSTPQRFIRVISDPFRAREIPGNSEKEFPDIQGRHALHPLPQRPAEWSFWTLLGATGGTQTHSRRTGGKLGRLRRARQGLVRVPESNTKYGGKEGITGVCRACDRAQVSVSPGGFPREKMMRGRAPQSFHPLFTGRPRNRPGERCRRNFPLATERIWAGMPTPSWSPSQISGMVGSHPTVRSSHDS
jgi:hypothetical protein